MARRRHNESPLSLFSFQDIITSVTGILVLLTLILALDLTTREAASSVPTLETRAVASEVQETLAQTQAKLQALQQQLDAQTAATTELARLTPTAALQQQAELDRELATLAEDTAQLQANVQSKEKDGRELERKSTEKASDRERVRQLQQQSDLVQQQLAELKRSNRVFYRPRAGDGKRAWLVDIRARVIVVAPADAQHEQQVFEASTAKSAVSALVNWAGAQRRPGGEYFVLLVRPSGIDSFQDLEQRLLKAGFETGIDLVGSDLEIFPSSTAQP